MAGAASCQTRVSHLNHHPARVFLTGFARRHSRQASTQIRRRALVTGLTVHRASVKTQHEADLAAGAGSVWLPDALAVKYPRAPWEWGWQWVFPATWRYVDRETGVRRRHHLHESVLQRAFEAAVRESGCRRRRRATRYGIRLRRICSRVGTTF